MKTLATFLLLCALFASLTTDALARTTRDLVFEDEDAAVVNNSAEETLAIKSTIVLERDGQKSTVVPSYEFISGDRIQLVFTPNTDGYVYWLAKGSSGNYSILFPSAKAGVDNAVVRNTEYTVPVRGAFKFDDVAGQEELLCILSKDRLQDIDRVVAVSASLDANTAEKLQGTTGQASQRTTRDLVFEDEDTGDVNTKSQTLPKGEPLVTHFVLTHK